MNDEQRNTITLESLATILGGSFLISYAVLLVWFLFFLLAPDCFVWTEYKMVPNKQERL